MQATAVETYNLKAGNGRHIRIATLVRLPDGTEIRFTERMGKREALRQAQFELDRRAAQS